jgi:hypothetical protein
MGKPLLVPRQKCEAIQTATVTDVSVYQALKAPSLWEGAYSALSSPTPVLDVICYRRSTTKRNSNTCKYKA